MRKLQFLLFFLFIVSSVAYSQIENPVSWEYKTINKGDGIHQIVFDAKIVEPWHVYAIKLKEEGPIPTTFIIEKGEGFKILGETKELTKPKIKFDKGFGFDVGVYAKNASFSQDIKVLTEKNVTVEISIEFQCCNDEVCLPPFIEIFKIPLDGYKNNSSENASTNVQSEDTSVIITPFLPVDTSDSLNNSSGEITIDDEPQESSLWLFLLIAFAAGLAAILTPCVFPMIPLTISFFMKGSENRGQAIFKGLIFGLSMIFVYTGIGVLVSLTGLDANIGNMLGTHWIPNLIFFLLFMVFAASFFGLFELVLPSGMINKSDMNAEKGGIIGIFFMGVTTVLVSFSCTGPIVGSLLIEAAGGEVLKPILGMFFFSLAFALPFTILAIFPTMLKSLPKSGGWLNSVKIVLGFLVLAFGMKFLSNIDQSYHLGIFTREIYLGIWFILSILMGLYLLGKIKFSNDGDLPFISVPRLLLVIASFTFSVYLFTGILGADLINISALIPPKSSQSFALINPNRSTVAERTEYNNWCGPGKYDEIFMLPSGLKGYFNYEDGLACAKEKNKPIFLDFTGHSCSNCKQMENLVWPAPEVLSKLKNDYVIISLYTDDKTKLAEKEWITRPDGKILKTIGDVNKFIESDKFKSISTPLYVLLDPSGELLLSPRGKDLDVKSFAGYLQKGIDQFNLKK